MIETISKKAMVSINNVWFIGADYDTRSARGQIQFLHGVKEDSNIIGKPVRESEQKTLITDLLEEESRLWQGISKTYRNEIRRCEKEERKNIFLLSDEILANPNLIDTFEKTYNEMFAAKGMKDKFNRKLFIAYARNNTLVTSVAYRSDNEPVVFHSYIVDDKNARFWYSCSNFREDKGFAEEIGRLNKYLHWKDFLEMKKRGVESYDWGGIGLSEQTKGIAEFKRKFGGTELVYRNCIYAKNRIIRWILGYYLNKK